jgi:hypothetical protein
MFHSILLIMYAKLLLKILQFLLIINRICANAIYIMTKTFKLFKIKFKLKIDESLIYYILFNFFFMHWKIIFLFR